MSKTKHLISEVTNQPDFPELEKKMLAEWYHNGIVNKYLSRNYKSTEKFFFQDGPITANNPMGVHHAWGRTYKDLYQRYKNMCGFKQRFQNGFDCQGLWVEVEVEKELGFKSKKDIETFGVAKFVDLCKQRVIKYSGIQTEQSKRLGYFMDWDNSYFTMSDQNNYSIWHFLKICWQKGWIYKGHDSVPWCPRCETAISQHEMLTEDYKEITHRTVYLGLPITGTDDEYLLVWTTTPWTIPANIAVAVDEDLDYSLVKTENGQKYWVAKARIEAVFLDQNQKTEKTVKGSELVGLRYQGPFDHLPAVKVVADSNSKFHTVVPTDPLIMPITTEEGTGLVHTAVSAGTEDFQLGKKLGLPMVPVIADNADYLEGLGFLTGQNAKKHPEIIIDFLSENNKEWLFKVENYTHRYPACWRCKAELVWKVADEWYIAMDVIDPDDKKGRTLRQKMIDVAKEITWEPKFGLDREIDWLKNMHDWLISKKNRYWGLALPIWVCDKCNQFEVVGGPDELEKRAVAGWDEFKSHSPHKPFIDSVKISCSCGGIMSRIPDVGNPWLDAGIVPYSTLVDPENGKVSYLDDKKYWKQWFPADFITESFPGQFKNWFYSMIAMSTVLEDRHPFKSVLGFASMLGEDGRPMHKSWGNSIEFNEGADKIGVDVMRWIFAKHNPERNLLFGYKMASETKRLFHMILWNSYRFFVNYVSLENWTPDDKKYIPSIIDRWILTRLDQVVTITTSSLEKYNTSQAAEEIESFVADLSTWYIRRSRNRVGPAALDNLDKHNCYQTLYIVFDILSRILMPFMPFISDSIYTNITGNESVHLADWPLVTDPANINTELLSKMADLRKICELGHSQRKLANIAVKQPLSCITVSGAPKGLHEDEQLIQLIKDELNIEDVRFIDNQTSDITIDLDLVITDELVEKGKLRDLLRNIQEARKQAGCRLNEIVDLVLPDWPEKYTEEIKNKTLVRNIAKGESIQIKRSE